MPTCHARLTDWQRADTKEYLPCNVVPVRWMLLRAPEGKPAPVALLSTDVALTTEMIVIYFARRWSVEVTLQETKAHLAVESQRQWSQKAIERTTPVLLVNTTAWYQKEKPTFRDAMAAVRRLLWQKFDSSTSTKHTKMVNIPCIIYSICWLTLPDVKVEFRLLSGVKLS